MQDHLALIEIKNNFVIRYSKHINLQGNERADTLAKLSCKVPVAPGINSPVSDLNRLIKSDKTVPHGTYKLEA